jgi:hypothetical protein
MRNLQLRTALLVCFIAALVTTSNIVTRAYGTYGHWTTSSVPIYINPQNLDVSASAAEAAVQYGMNVWNTQGGANFRFGYGGRVNDTTTGFDNRNVVIFRNASDGGGAIATTYSWSSGGVIVDADVIFWDGAFTFYTGTSGCSGGAYIEDVAAHELGHVLGLLHSSVAEATMVSGYPYCSQELRTLATDDISGIRSLYGSGGGSASAPATNASPTVTITSPTASGSYQAGAAISFAGTGTDAEDGNVSSSLSWVSSLDGKIGSGSALSATLSAGTHVITATATDSSGSSGYSTVTIVVGVTSTATKTPTLSASGTKQKRQIRTNLQWSGFTAATLDIYRNGGLILSTPNDGSQTDTIKTTGGTFVYQACGQGTSVCSNQVTVAF